MMIRAIFHMQNAIFDCFTFSINWEFLRIRVTGVGSEEGLMFNRYVLSAFGSICMIKNSKFYE